ncbi:MAG TPA: tRNA (N(6)-L-threonylcarbamoyladenosine(37)-C(2))-methylthiotransferase [Candidatus Nanoarchaeia archaeon]|nr:tRNA (N(6)-L-threonylcarbamoyladenosine(37)-C(2))-methylthiotransferase [Candidatus Nanoarchaeia archaeon]
MTRIYIMTQGCTANMADSEYMKGILKEAKFDLANSLEESDVVIINTCTVKTPSENELFRTLENIRREHPYKVIVLAGCLAQTEPKKLKDYCVVGTSQIHKVVSVVEEALHDNVVHALETGEMPPLNLPKVRKNPIIEIIPINRGCLSACTFCKTKQARGNLRSYPVADIIAVAKKALRESVQEFWLTSQDTMCYGFDLDTNLATLLKELLALPGKFKIRVGMGNPVHLKTFKDELFPLFQSEKLFQFLHLPAQSGSDAVLKEMKRGNSAAEFLSLVEEAKQLIPRLTLATDIIIGFPAESDDDHWQTLELLRKTSPDVINLSRFWARPKTPAALLKQVPSDVIKHRSKIVTDIAENIVTLQNERWMGWEGEILIDEEGKEPGQWIGRNPSYKQVIVHGDFKLGDWVQVRITKTTVWDLRGDVLR